MEISDFKNYCDSIHKKIDQYQDMKKKFTQREIRKDLRKIKFISKNLIKKENDILHSSELWLLDNYYLIESEGKGILRGRTILPHRICSTANALLNFTDNVINKEMLDAFFESAFKADPLIESDYAHAKAGFVAVLIHRIHLAYIHDRNAIPTLITSLRHISVTDFDPFRKEYSPIELLFQTEPTGYYVQCDDKTKNGYKRALKKQAKMSKTTEFSLLEQYLNTSKEEYQTNPTSKKAFVGYYLTAPRKGYGYFFVLFSLFILSMVIIVVPLMRTNSAWITILSALFLAIPVFESSKLLVEFAYSLLVRNEPLPRLELDTIPPNGKTLTVISSLFHDKDEISSLFDKLELIYLKNKTKDNQNLNFGILADFPESDEPVSSSDREFYEHAKEKIDVLNQRYGDVFHLFLRERVYSETSGKFMGYERKRGALCELCDFLHQRLTTFSYYCGTESKLENTQYVVTLDCDTNLGIGQLSELIGVMVHPLNKPEIEEINGINIVTGGYGVIQPGMKPTLRSTSRSSFSTLVSYSAGHDVYSFAGFDTFQTLFGKGVFCGKGIMDVEAFDLTVNNTFPDERILSHDILEGTRLSCGLITDMYLTDEQPSTVVSWNKRAHRWIRGDVQSFPFAFPHYRDKFGRKVKNPISLLNQYILCNALRSWLYTPAVVLLIFLSVFTNTPTAAVLLTVGFTPIYLPFILTMITTVLNLRFQPVYRNYFNKVTSGFWQTFLMIFYRIITLFTDAKNVTDAMVRS
ncbi:MAG TPA: hypothetical protein DCY75_10830, partial [Clostridiales bacterium]|nr:hypothetical protein [Clostridiales bacterium]